MKLHLFPFTSNKAADAVAEACHTSTYHCISPIEKLRLLVTQHACRSAVIWSELREGGAKNKQKEKKNSEMSKEENLAEKKKRRQLFAKKRKLF